MDRVLVTIVILDKHPVLRITKSGVVTDLALNEDQAKLLLRQLAQWLTR